jgi:hypothetical protein
MLLKLVVYVLKLILLMFSYSHDNTIFFAFPKRGTLKRENTTVKSVAYPNRFVVKSSTNAPAGVKGWMHTTLTKGEAKLEEREGENVATNVES